MDAASRTGRLFSLYTKTTKVKTFRVQFDLNLTRACPPMRVILNFRDTEFVHRKGLQNLEFVDMRLFWGCLNKHSVTEFPENYDASLQDTGSEAD